MARTGNEEGESQEAQKGSRRLTLRFQVSTFRGFDLISYLFSQHVPYTSHARSLSFGTSSDSCPLLPSNAVFSHHRPIRLIIQVKYTARYITTVNCQVYFAK